MRRGHRGAHRPLRQPAPVGAPPLGAAVRRRRRIRRRGAPTSPRSSRPRLRAQLAGIAVLGRAPTPWRTASSSPIDTDCFFLRRRGRRTMSLTDRAGAAGTRSNGKGGPAAGRNDLRIFLVAGEHSGDALGGKLMSALSAQLQGPHPLSRRRRRGHGARGPCLAVPARGRRRHGVRVDPGAPAAHHVARLPHGRCGGRRRTRRRRHHRCAGVHASDRQAHPQARAEHPHHRLCVAERVGVAAGAGAQDARLRRSRHGPAAVRAGRAPAPRRSAVHLRRASADRKARLAARS